MLPRTQLMHFVAHGKSPFPTSELIQERFMECTRCGTQVGESHRYCFQCGESLRVPSDHQHLATEIEPAPSPLPFDSSRPPLPGQEVPVDCVWSGIPYPGPLPGDAFRGNIPQRLVRAGVLQGRMRSEIEKLIGSPQSASATGDGGTLLQWMSTSAWGQSWHYGLLFDAYGVCAGISHEYVS